MEDLEYPWPKSRGRRKIERRFNEVVESNWERICKSPYTYIVIGGAVGLSVAEIIRNYQSISDFVSRLF